MSELASSSEFFPLVYDELRRLAASKLRGEASGHTLNATALVHEAYLRLGSASFGDPGDFFRAVAVAMQRILVDHARGKRAAKRGGTARRFVIGEADRITLHEPDWLLDVDAAVARLAAEDPATADLARLRLFVGMTVEEAGQALGLSRASAFREWAYARAWLTIALRASLPPDRSADAV